MKRKFSGLTLKDVMVMLQQQDFTRWQIHTSPRPPSDFLQEALRRFDAFNLTSSESAKLLLIDVLFVEIVPSYPKLRVWKAALLESDTLTGVADYLIAPKRAYLATPLLCAVEAKRDDFEQGRTQCLSSRAEDLRRFSISGNYERTGSGCLAEMAACQWNNRQESHDCDVFGIVSNGQDWQFYKLTRVNGVYETEIYPMINLPELLGALDYVCAECAKNVP